MSGLSGNQGATRDVALQDQTTATIILPMVQALHIDALAANAAIDALTITVVDSTGFVIGQHLRIINSAADRFYFGEIVGIAGNDVALDTPIDFAYVSGSEVTVSNTNMAVNGSVTPVIFKLRTGSPSIPSDVDITRVILQCTALTAVDLNKFGDLPALTNGLVFRRIDGIQLNIFNVKDNAGIAGLTYDFTVYAASNPSQAVDGFISRLTFAGQNKVGVALRIDAEGNLEMIIQDDLSGLVSLVAVLEGHVVENYNVA